MRRSQLAATATALVAPLALFGGCAKDDPAAAPRSPVASPTQTPSVTGTPAPTPTPTGPPIGSVAPTWLGTRPLPTTSAGFGVQRPTPPELRIRRFTLPDVLAPLPGKDFAFRIIDPAPADVIARSTWKTGCPVAADQLAWIRLTFWGFDHRRHTGELLVNRSAADGMVAVFRTLYAERFPIEEMRITTRREQDAKPTGDGNNTTVFACRPVVGSTTTSQHAYGLAIDVNPFQNPYVKGDLVLPELAGSYAFRARDRPGMIEPGDRVVRAFAAVGWQWGGDWNSLKDWQHFSANGR